MKLLQKIGYVKSKASLLRKINRVIRLTNEVYKDTDLQRFLYNADECIFGDIEAALEDKFMSRVYNLITAKQIISDPNIISRYDMPNDDNYFEVLVEYEVHFPGEDYYIDSDAICEFMTIPEKYFYMSDTDVKQHLRVEIIAEKQNVLLKKINHYHKSISIIDQVYNMI